MVTRLMQLGLDKDEAEAYVQLYVIGPCRAGDVADAMNVHQTKSYWAMNHLVKKGFARALPSTPTRYEAIPPGEIARQTLKEREERIEEIARHWDAVADPLKRLRDDNLDAVAEDLYRLVHGRREVVKVVESAFDRMEERLCVYSANPWAHLAPQSYAPIWRAGVEKAEEGVEAYAIFHTNDELRDAVAPLLDLPTVQVRHVEPDRRNPFLIVDEREIVFWLVTDPDTDPGAEREVAVWSTGEDLVAEQHEVFRTLWENARELAEVEAADPADRAVGAE